MRGHSRERFWGELLRRHDGRLRAYCRRTRCSRDELDQIVWDVRDDATAHEADLRAADDPWDVLLPLVRRRCSRYVHRWRHELPLPVDVCVSEPDPDSFATADPLSWWAKRLLEALPAKQRWAVDLRYR